MDGTAMELGKVVGEKKMDRWGGSSVSRVGGEQAQREKSGRYLGQ